MPLANSSASCCWNSAATAPSVHRITSARTPPALYSKWGGKNNINAASFNAKRRRHATRRREQYWRLSTAALADVCCRSSKPGSVRRSVESFAHAHTRQRRPDHAVVDHHNNRQTEVRASKTKTCVPSAPDHPRRRRLQLHARAGCDPLVIFLPPPVATLEAALRSPTASPDLPSIRPRTLRRHLRLLRMASRRPCLGCDSGRSPLNRPGSARRVHRTATQLTHGLAPGQRSTARGRLSPRRTRS